jgi:uncharacterized membrane protein YozB (DUF420 family)
MLQAFPAEILAPLRAQLVLLLEATMGVGLIGGAWLARVGRYRQHAWCQSTIVLINLAVIVWTMVPSFETSVLPRIPQRLNRPYYLLATTHAVIGSAAEILALYILLAAGTRLLPEKYRITRFKLWMRSVLVLWWTALLLGIATFTRWYVPTLWR